MSTQLQLTNTSISISISTLSELGSLCDRDERCNNFIPFTVCINNVCACASDYIPNSANNKCLQGEDKIVYVSSGDFGL
jgi:hypothetical protein